MVQTQTELLNDVYIFTLNDAYLNETILAFILLVLLYENGVEG
jgi:hypothetical protein